MSVATIQFGGSPAPHIFRLATLLPHDKSSAAKQLPQNSRPAPPPILLALSVRHDVTLGPQPKMPSRCSLALSFAPPKMLRPFPNSKTCSVSASIVVALRCCPWQDNLPSTHLALCSLFVLCNSASSPRAA